VGLPLIEAYFGKEFLGIGIILDQLGTFLALGTVGVLFAFYAKSDTWNFSEMGKMVFYFPPSQALAIAFLSKIFIYPEWLDNILLRLGDTLTPIALVSIGMQLKISDIRIEAKSILLGLTYKLLLAPLIIFLIYIFSLNTRSDHLNVIVFESGMGPMVTGTIIAIENELNERLASVILGVGILVSILSTNVLYSLLQIQF
jgi:predicted permease